MHPPLQTDQTANEADTQTDKSHDNESQNQRIAGDRSGEGPDPSDSFIHEGSDSGENGRNSDSSSE